MDGSSGNMLIALGRRLRSPCPKVDVSLLVVMVFLFFSRLYAELFSSLPPISLLSSCVFRLLNISLTSTLQSGILNYQGTNWIGIELWAQQATGAALKNFTLVPTVVVQSGYGPVELVDSPSWTPRAGAY